MEETAAVSSRQALARLRRGDVALVGKARNQPVIVFRFGRWHMITLGWVANSRLRMKRGIENLHFMSPRRARSTVVEWLPYSELLALDAVCPAFREELAAKVLPTADDYRTLIHKVGVVLAGGHTTDTLHGTGTGVGDDDLLVARIERWMRAGEMGPFLHFRRTYDALDEVAAPE